MPCAVKISESVYWVGAQDWSVRNFHGYTTESGTSYNAFLVMDEKITLIDTVKEPFREEMLARIASVVDPSKIEYFISNHAEMDHSGAIPFVLEKIKPKKIFASVNGVKALQKHFEGIEPLTAVKNGERLSLGKMDISFVETKLLHWPDSMFSYLHGEEILFSQDAFGMHLATSQLFDDENDPHVLKSEAATYYANILLPLSELVKKCLDAYASMGLNPKIVAPDHGPLWRSKISDIFSWYREWSEQKPEKRALLVYDTMWGSTAKIANSIAEGIVSTGVPVKILPISSSHRSIIATEAMLSGAIVIGSPTINNMLFPTVADTICYLRGLKPKNKIGTAFGSYGWSGESVKQLSEFLKAIGAELLPPEGMSVKFVPNKEELAASYELGRSVGARLLEICK